MAKTGTGTENTAADVATEAEVNAAANVGEPPVAGSSASSAGANQIILNVPKGDVSGLEGPQPRAHVIRTLARSGKWTRGDIAKHITKLQYTPEQQAAGSKVTYQAIFQATKNIPNVKKAPREMAAESTPATPATEATAS